MHSSQGCVWNNGGALAAAECRCYGWFGPWWTESNQNQHRTSRVFKVSKSLSLCVLMLIRWAVFSVSVIWSASCGFLTGCCCGNWTCVIMWLTAKVDEGRLSNAPLCHSVCVCVCVCVGGGHPSFKGWTTSLHSYVVQITMTTTHNPSWQLIWLERIRADVLIDSQMDQSWV